ncbi:unnamed protein product [Urochloa humidicola]
MAAAPARTFSFSAEPLLLSASPAAAARKDQRGHPRGGSIRPSVATSKALLPSDFDLQQEGLTNIQKMLLQRRNSAREVIATIDNLKRLCIDHYFEEEIQSAMGACMELIHSDDLFDATLAFRLLREAGHDVSADDVLRRFTDDTGEFKLALSKDIRGLLSLHDMSHLDMGEEASLYKAKEFSSKHLASAIRYLEPGLARYVRQSLDHPYHLSLMQYKARHHLTYLQSLPTRDTAMEELAIAEFQLNKRLHQKEMHEVKRWWKDLGLCHEIPVVRDQVLKFYMWPMTILQGSSLSTYRIEATKIISLVYVVDDIFDLVGTPEELSLFTEAIKISRFTAQWHQVMLQGYLHLHERNRKHGGRGAWIQPYQSSQECMGGAVRWIHG